MINQRGSLQAPPRNELTSYRLSNLESFLRCLKDGPGCSDDDNMPQRFSVGPDWECSGLTFHSREEARQFFISECVLGKGLNRLVWRGITAIDIAALATALHDKCQSLGSPIRESAIRSSLFAACEEDGLLVESA